MKILKDITDASDISLIETIQKNCFGLFCTGLITGIAIVLAGMSSKNNDPGNSLLLSGIAIFFLFISVLLYTFVRKKILPELKRRLDNV